MKNMSAAIVALVEQQDKAGRAGAAAVTSSSMIGVRGCESTITTGSNCDVFGADKLTLVGRNFVPEIVGVYQARFLTKVNLEQVNFRILILGLIMG